LIEVPIMTVRQRAGICVA